MATMLTPADALEYLAQLSTDVRAGAVLGAGGELLAGDPALLPAARDLLAACPAAEVEADTGDGVVLAARSHTHAVVVVCGPQVLEGLQRHDLRTVLADLAVTPVAA
jgi:hypothetical protein